MAGILAYLVGAVLFKRLMSGMDLAWMPVFTQRHAVNIRKRSLPEINFWRYVCAKHALLVHTSPL